jgi:HSP20 family molecular chaperone IbpA
VPPDDDVLTLRGEKKSEVEDKDRQFSERFYGQFERRIALGAEVEARFKNGVLTVTMPKTERAAEQGQAYRRQRQVITKACAPGSSPAPAFGPLWPALP